MHAKIFIEFVALIIRNKMHLCLRDENGNYMTVPAAIRELEKIEMLRQPDGQYRPDHAITKTQKLLLKAFAMTASNVREQVSGISVELEKMDVER